MPRTLSTPVSKMVADAKARITEYTSAQVIDMLERDDIVIVDIRDIRERQREGVIPGSYSCPRGMVEFWVDPDSPYFKDIFGQDDKEFIFHCAGGLRSALTVDVLEQMGFEKAAHISDGFAGWRAAGGPIERI